MCLRCLREMSTVLFSLRCAAAHMASSAPGHKDLCAVSEVQLLWGAGIAKTHAPLLQVRMLR